MAFSVACGAWWCRATWGPSGWNPHEIICLEHGLYFSIYWECHHPNWRTHIFQRGGSTTSQTKLVQFTRFLVFLCFFGRCIELLNLWIFQWGWIKKDVNGFFHQERWRLGWGGIIYCGYKEFSGSLLHIFLVAAMWPLAHKIQMFQMFQIKEDDFPLLS